MKKVFLVLSLTISLVSFSQSKKLWLKYGDDAYKKKDYPTAVSYYTKILDDTTILAELVLPYEVQIVNLKSKDFKQDTTRKIQTDSTKGPSKADYINHQLAECYRIIKDYDHASIYYKKVVDNNSYPNDAYYYYQSLMHNRSYSKAMEEFEKLVNSNISDSLKKLIQKSISSCYFAMDTNSYKQKIIVKKMDTVIFNRGTSNFAPMYYGSPTKLLFTGARPGGVLLNPEKQESKYLCDLYFTELSDTGWSKPVNFGRPVNTGLHEGSSVVTSDDIMFFTRWSDANKDESYIYMSKMKDGYFYEAYKLSETVNQKGFKAKQPYVSFDGTKLFFSSNKPGGQGGFDLYVCNIEENGLTGEAKNLGPIINTPLDEETPYFHAISNTLFFSSNGHVGVGGLDIFKSSLNVDDSVYSMPKNIGRPINSSKDDAYFILDRLQTKGYFASDREDCPGGNCYDIYEFENEPITFDISGVVFDEVTNDPIPGALVTVKDVHNDEEPLYLITDEKGFYSTPLKINMEYFLKAQKKGYFASSASVVTKGLTETTHFEQDFFLPKIPQGDIVIEGIEYDLNKATLRPRSKEILDKTVDLMVLNDNLSIEINSHTDTRGNDAYNMKLSQARAQSCVDYMISKGIKKERLLPTGYGETKPLVSDEEISKMVPKSEEFEAAHQKNRRTAFKVIGETDLNIIVK